eukprot:155723-Pyramimonas_sp.AAC.1
MATPLKSEQQPVEEDLTKLRILDEDSILVSHAKITTESVIPLHACRHVKAVKTRECPQERFWSNSSTTSASPDDESKQNLERRFNGNEIYTNVGPVLVSLNPYQPLPIYTPDILDRAAHCADIDIKSHHAFAATH